MPKLVIVESPTKARTIRSFLPADYEVQASMGHVRDLPESAADIPEEVKDQEWSRLGVNVHANFEPLYVIPKDKRKVVKELKEALKKELSVWPPTKTGRRKHQLAPCNRCCSPRGLPAAWCSTKSPARPFRKALQNCREVNEQLVRAQETRRILDRLVGYTLSPLLWKKIGPKLSSRAGAVGGG
jgi:DNA topoisomerase-1